jgi:hypothetical protein
MNFKVGMYSSKLKTFVHPKKGGLIEDQADMKNKRFKVSRYAPTMDVAIANNCVMFDSKVYPIVRYTEMKDEAGAFGAKVECTYNGGRAILALFSTTRICSPVAELLNALKTVQVVMPAAVVSPAGKETVISTASQLDKELDIPTLTDEDIANMDVPAEEKILEDIPW